MFAKIIDNNLAIRTDETGIYDYVGKATAGSLPSQAKWQIYRINETVTDYLTIQWADGTANFDKIWNNRASYSYS
jgi:hypothetical protein